MTVVAAAVALIVGFGTGWFGHRLHLASALESAAENAMAEQEESASEPSEDLGYEEDPAGTGEPVPPDLLGLDEVYDAGDGFTVRLTGVERRIAEDGYNPTTGEEGALPYLAWDVEITNGTGEPLYTGASIRSCSVGDPLREGESPHLGESINPPDLLADGQSATWEEDCWASEEDRHLQYTVEFHDEYGAIAYGPVTFSGSVE